MSYFPMAGRGIDADLKSLVKLQDVITETIGLVFSFTNAQAVHLKWSHMMMQKIKTRKNKCHVGGKKHIKVSILHELQ